MLKQYTVYALRDPATAEIRYVGVTGRPLPARLSAHLTDAYASPYGVSRRKAWIMSLKTRGLAPTIEPLEIRRCTLTKALGLERKHITSLRASGADLTNSDEEHGKRFVDPPGLLPWPDVQRIAAEALCAVSTVEKVLVGAVTRELPRLRVERAMKKLRIKRPS